MIEENRMDNEKAEIIKWIRSLDIEISDNPTEAELDAAIDKAINKSINESVMFGGHRPLNTKPYPGTGKSVVRHRGQRSDK